MWVIYERFPWQTLFFENGLVLFEPTKCAVEQFRLTKAEAESYFIAGDNRACAEDKGFAGKSVDQSSLWKLNIILEENRAIAMGNYFFTDLNGDEAKVEYTFGYTWRMANKNWLAPFFIIFNLIKEIQKVILDEPIFRITLLI